MSPSKVIDNENTEVVEKTEVKEKTPTKKATTSKKTTTAKKASTTKKTTTKKTTATKTTKKAATTKKTSTTKKAAGTTTTKKTTAKKNPVVEKEKTNENLELENKESVIIKKEDSSDNTVTKEPLVKITPKEPLPRTEDLIMKDELNHVEILKKKIQAQKKLNEEVSQNPLKVQITEESERMAMALDEDNKILEEDNKLLNSELEKLKEENDSLKKKVETLEDDVNQKEERIIVLTNSMVGKTSEENLAKELESLRKENESLLKELKEKEANIEAVNNAKVEEVKEEKNQETKEKDYDSEVSSKGELALKIKLLNDRILEKEDKIKEVEEELNNLSEKDIVEESFITKIKEIRNIKKESIRQANFELENLAEQVKSTEEKLIAKKKAYADKEKELKDYDKSLEGKPMNFTEKEDASKLRTRLTIEKDSIYVDIETNEEYYKKLLTRYNNRLAQAEERVKVVEKAESELVEFYLNKLKETKTNENEDYKSEKQERERLLNELQYLSKKIEDTMDDEEEALTLDSYDIEKVSKAYAKVVAKLNLIDQKYEERSKVEKILLKNEPVVKEYYDAFCNREICLLNIDENTNKLNEYSDKEQNDKNISKIDTLTNLINDDKQKVEYYSKILESNRKDEKVDFYIKLINSMAELKNAEKEFKSKAEKLLEKIKTLESAE